MLVLASGCVNATDGDGDGNGNRATPSATYNENYRPIEGYSEGDEAPMPMVDKVKLKDLEETSARGRDSGAAEDFVALIASLQMDTRAPLEGEKFLDQIAAPGLPPEVREHIEQDVDIQRNPSSDRHFDADIGGFLRSEIVGSRASPERVNVEVVGFLVIEKSRADIDGWYGARYDVVWTKDGWKLIDHSDGMPTLGTEEEYLNDPTWRRIPSRK